MTNALLWCVCTSPECFRGSQIGAAGAIDKGSGSEGRAR
jgi:hypothetical protein